MITIKEYVVPDTLDEAYELLTSKKKQCGTRRKWIFKIK